MKSPFDVLPGIANPKLPFEPYPGATGVIESKKRGQSTILDSFDPASDPRISLPLEVFFRIGVSAD
jgi:hypothetical protein